MKNVHPEMLKLIRERCMMLADGHEPDANGVVIGAEGHEGSRHEIIGVGDTDAAARIAELEEAVRVLAEAFDTVERHCGYDNFAGTKGVDLVDAKGFLDRMTSGNYMHHSRAAVGYIGRVLAWINKTSTAMNLTRKKIRANPTANAALEAARRNA